MVAPDADLGHVLFSAASLSQLPDIACKRQNRGMQYLFSVLAGIYAHFTGIVLGCSELPYLIDFDSD